MRVRIRLALLATLVLGACGGDDAASPDAHVGPDAPPAPDAGPDPDLRGLVEVMETETPYGPASYVRARFHAVREPRWHQVALTAGDCALYTFEQGICDPPCTDGLCVAGPTGDTCEPWPDFTGAGTLTVTGLPSPLTIEPDIYGNYYNQDALPADLFDDGDPIGATLAGSADIPPLDLATTGVAVVRDRFANDEITLTNGQDFTVTWTPGGGDRVLLTLNANNQGHGAPFLSIIRCDVPDADGELTVPAAIVDQFDETYRWEICAGSDCPMSTLRRYREDTAAIDGGIVRFLVGSELTFWVVHDAP